MDIALETIDLWKIDGELEPQRFLIALESLLSPGDIAVFAAYSPTQEQIALLVGIGAIRKDHLPEFHTCFDVNRDEYPDGCAFELKLGQQMFSEFAGLSKDILSQSDKPEFFDHLIAYRPGSPNLPLVSFHDAFCGGDLMLSGLYTLKEVARFAEMVGCSSTLVSNPALN